MSAVTSPDLFVFEAPTPHGPLRLSVPPGTGDAVADTLAAALLLGPCEGLLLALEEWLGLPIDPAPLGHVADTVAPMLSATVSSAALAPVGTRVSLPWQLLATPRPMPQALHRGALVWAPIAFEAELARYARAPLPGGALSSGGMLLLPGSFEAPWRVRLLQRALAIELGATWRGPGSAIETTGPARPLAHDVADAWRVVLSAPLRLDPLRSLAPASAGVDVSPPRPADDCAAALFAPAHTAPVARGVVTPALQGAGLWIAAEAHDVPSRASAPAVSETATA